MCEYNWSMWYLRVIVYINLFLRRWFAKIPACGRPYIPFSTRTSRQPFSSTLSLRLQWLMTLSGKCSIFIRGNSGRSIGVFKQKSFKSNVMNFAPGMDITLLSSSLTVSKSAVGVPQSIGTDRLLPPKVNLVLLTSSFQGRTLHTILEYATSFHLFSGTSLFVMNFIVFVPEFLPGMPCANLPISFPNEYPQSFLNLGCFIRWRYSSNSPVSVSSTDPAKSHKNVMGYLRPAA